MKSNIIIAAENPFNRARMAKALGKKSYSVDTTGSAACLMGTLLHGAAPIVVLGDGLEEGLSVAQLIPLLKSCNPKITIILAVDKISPAEAVQACQEGVFYRTNHSGYTLGWDELQKAVDCACNKRSFTACDSRTH